MKDARRVNGTRVSFRQPIIVFVHGKQPLVSLLNIKVKNYIKYHSEGYLGADHPGEGVLGFSFAGYVPLASQSPCPIIVYFVASYRPHLSHFWKNVIVAIPTKSLSICASTLSRGVNRGM